MEVILLKRALINVDYTYDFVAEDGKLTCGIPGQSIEKAIIDITREFLEKGDFVTFGIDAHEENDPLHPESNLFPPHNIIGTSGLELYGELKSVYDSYKDVENLFYFHK